MRISELSRLTAVSIPSIKYYLREGLLPAGHSTGTNQADYGEAHVLRLRLIRAMIDIAGVSVASAKLVISAIDAPELPLAHVFGVAQNAVSQSATYLPSDSDVSRDRVEALAAQRGWPCWDESPGSAGAANVIDAFVATGHPELVELMDPYAEAAELVARADLAAVQRQPDVTAMAETVVVGTVLGDALFASLRRMAQVAVTEELFPSRSHSVPAAIARPDRTRS